MKINAVLDTFALQIWTADATTGLLTFVNEFTAAYFGKTREELIGEGWQNVLHSADVPLAVEAWARSIRTGEPYQVEFRLLRASDRTYRWHRASAKTLETADGITWIGSNVDIDAERRGEEVIKAWRERLKAESL